MRGFGLLREKLLYSGAPFNPVEAFVGVDGGATKTLAVAGDAEGCVLGVGEAGPSNYHVVGIDGAVENINAAIRGGSRRRSGRRGCAGPGGDGY
ncbi:BadF/BadG/BcrA/BcrD ATPase family protein [Thermofilum pendens]|uniref:BadF/BadG/BcrA/BcrD ATPase family protein n=1 Tax=Thermofilum pendens TaxID=2269 RepID=UPI0000DCA5DC|nr:BadF/BadG/BcrA/BcrD ATPase family protein [Thermofilum pendens]